MEILHIFSVTGNGKRENLTENGNWGAAAAGHLIRPLGAPVSLRVGRFADLTRHRRVIQHRGPLEGKANEGAPPGGRLGDVFIVLYTVGRKVL